jgi:CheY-like chemotaxis protein
MLWMQDAPTYRILYVDDEDDIREIAQLCLELEPAFDVRVMSTGRDALLEVRSWRPDLLLLDMMMPDLDGPETLRRLREDPSTSNIPVVFVTARTRADDVERLLRLGALGVIGKPFDPMMLSSQVRHFLPS